MFVKVPHEGQTKFMTEQIQIENGWREKLQPEFQKDYMKDLNTFLADELAKGKTIYPDADERFSALNMTDFRDVKVVIIGQDPYHGPGQAHGMCFSVKPGVKVPPSLANIYKEMKSDLGIEPASHGYLQHWAEQGVLLLNTVLTVEKSKANSHQKKGWEKFTDKIIQLINEERENVVFLLWGSPAQKKSC
jgi:uracil-DNA glycosylase